MGEEQPEFIETYSRRLPVYLLLDCSGSMAGAAITAVNDGLKLFEAAVKNDPHARETMWVGMITFGETVQQIGVLTEVPQFQAPILTAGGTTPLGGAFKKLRNALDGEVRERVGSEQPGDYKPLIFLMTDGEPTDDWEPAVQDFKKRDIKKSANIIAIGCGEAVNMETLKKITETVLIMPEMDEEKIKSLFMWISQSSTAASRRVSESQVDETEQSKIGMQLPPPPPGIQIEL